MISPLQKLSSSDLRALAEAIRSGRLDPPFTPVSVQRYLPGPDTGIVASELQQFIVSTNSESLALFLEVLADDRINRSQPEDVIDLVSTGPEAPGTANRDTSVVVRELFSQAKDYVLVAGYAVYQGRDVFRALAERMDKLPSLNVRMYLDVQRKQGDTTKDSEILRAFAQRFKKREWPGKRLPQVYFDPRALGTEQLKRSSLHAKCIVVDRTCSFVSSANFTEAAQVRNIEVGVLVRSPYFANQLSHHFEALAEAGFLRPVPGI